MAGGDTLIEWAKVAGGWVAAVIVAVFAFLGPAKKAEVDEITVVLAKWKELTENHQQQLKLLTEELVVLRIRVKDLEAELLQRLTEIKELNRSLDAEKRRVSRDAMKDAISSSLGGVTDGKQEKGK